MENKIKKFEDNFQRVYNNVSKYKYDIASNNISIYFFEMADKINCYILPKDISFNIVSEIEFLKHFQDKCIKIIDIKRENLNKLLVNLINRYNLSFANFNFIKENLEYDYLLGYIKNSGEFATNTNVYIHYPTNLIKAKKI